MLHIALYLLTTLELALVHVVWGGQVLPPPPTSTPAAELYFINGTYEFYEDHGLVCINLTLNEPAPCNMTVEVIEESGSATRGLDYESGPHFVNFAEGDRSAQFYINITDDNELEMNEDFTLRINESSLCPNVSLEPYEAKVIIMDDEYIFCFESLAYSVLESTGEAEVSLRLSRPLRRDIMVSFNYLDLTAFGNGIDYYASYAFPDKATIPAGTTEFLLKVKIVDDKIQEDNKLFRIVAVPPDIPDGRIPCSVDFIIRDDDDFRVTFEEATYIVCEGYDVTVKLLLIYPEDHIRHLFPINVTIDEIDITATGGSTDAGGIDFIYQNYSLSFVDGETSKMLIVRIIDDDMMELDETYNLSISIATSRRVIVGENSTTTITIKNDDYDFVIPIEVKFANSTFIFHELSGLARPMLHLNSTSDCCNISVKVKIEDLTATGGEDYEKFPDNCSEVIFPTGRLSAPFDVMIRDDDIFENSEVFRITIVNISVPCGVGILGNPKSAVVTILDDDDLIVLSFTKSSFSISERNGPSSPVLELSRPLNCCTISVRVLVQNNSAVGGEDFERPPGDFAEVIFPAGKTRASFEVIIIDDDMYERSETFHVTIDPISVPLGVVLRSPRSSIVTIIDNDDLIVLNFTKSSFSISEGNGPSSPVLELSRPLNCCTISVRVLVQNNSAVGGEDFVRLPGDFAEVIFPAGKTRASFEVIIFDDVMYERSEAFRVTIISTSVPHGVVLGSPRSSIVTIIDNDAPTLRFVQETYTVNEDDGLVTAELSLSNPSSIEINVEVNTVKITANESDYVSGPYDVVFPVNTTTAVLRVNITDDHVHEINETFILVIDERSLPPQVRVNGSNSAEVTIVDDEETMDCSVTVVRGSIKHNNRRKRTTLRFSSDGDPLVNYECKLDDKNFKDCKSPKVWKNLKKGRHVVTVRAFCTDDEGNRSTTTSRKFKFRVRLSL